MMADETPEQESITETPERPLHEGWTGGEELPITAVEIEDVVRKGLSNVGEFPVTGEEIEGSKSSPASDAAAEGSSNDGGDGG